MNIDLIIIFRVVLTFYVVVALQLNEPHIFTALPSFLKYSLNSHNSINKVLGSITKIGDLSDCALVKILLFGDQYYTQVENACIINATIKYVVDSERFNGPLL